MPLSGSPGLQPISTASTPSAPLLALPPQPRCTGQVQPKWMHPLQTTPPCAGRRGGCWSSYTARAACGPLV